MVVWFSVPSVHHLKDKNIHTLPSGSVANRLIMSLRLPGGSGPKNYEHLAHHSAPLPPTRDAESLLDGDMRTYKSVDTSGGVWAFRAIQCLGVTAAVVMLIILTVMVKRMADGQGLIVLSLQAQAQALAQARAQ